MEYLRVALPTRSVEVEITFSMPQPSVLSSSFRTSWSIVTVTATSTFPAASGVPESMPVADLEKGTGTFNLKCPRLPFFFRPVGKGSIYLARVESGKGNQRKGVAQQPI